jgi:hypothetical protein
MNWVVRAVWESDVRSVLGNSTRLKCILGVEGIVDVV